MDMYDKIFEHLKLQFGGSFDPNSRMISGVIDFYEYDIHIIERKLYDIQSWIIAYPQKTIILYLSVLDTNDW
ncbi:MAG: hypothetical protein LBE18_09980 [Planctomycetaceae bacterium]|jgi:hypothetical protein|nr:hypothetical protein [Planctomycetaceae bacterium]